jgi:hypothetical protein
MTVPHPWSAAQAASLFDAVIFVHQEDAKVTYLLKVFFKYLWGSVEFQALAGTLQIQANE